MSSGPCRVAAGRASPVGEVRGMNSQKAVRTDRELECPRIDEGLRARGLRLVTLPDGTPEEVLAAEVADADLLLTCYAPVTARVLGAARRLRGVVKYGVGIDAIDIDAARRLGIPVVNVPEYAEQTVAEGAFAMILALAKRLMPLRDAMEAGGWVWPGPEWLARDLAGKTLGIVGVGRIGRSVARMALGFRMNVVGVDPRVSAAEMRANGVLRRERLDDLLRESDVVSLHAVLNPETRHLLGARELALMGPGAFLINVSRGALVDELALVRAVVDGRIGGVGLDVYSSEPLARSGHPLSALFGRPNVLLMPHLTFYTVEAMDRLSVETLARCDELLSGAPVLVRSTDPRLRAQERGVRFVDAGG